MPRCLLQWRINNFGRLFRPRCLSTLYGDRSIQCILRKNPYSWHQQTKPLECHQYIRSRACRKDQDVNVIFHDSVTLSVSLTPCFDMANGPFFVICFFYLLCALIKKLATYIQWNQCVYFFCLILPLFLLLNVDWNTFLLGLKILRYPNLRSFLRPTLTFLF